ncbi:unnamed protein product [Oikopleura dioica]|uniref:Potassium channel tetramerisation-type BTB domain-containing protein n=1 Tax=Oikopleura dioica TaxID=34765 RepID=E4YFH7_OIKDI|nr:unnamed protein product [Oikopleura dioica]
MEETRSSTNSNLTEKREKSILGTWRKRRRFYSLEHGDYFIDRHRPTFEVVLDYFVYGELRRPADIPLDIFVNELCYYNLDKNGLEGFLHDEGILMVEQEKTVKEKKSFKSKMEKAQFKVWQCLEDPQSSKIALAYSIVSMVITISSVIMLCLDSLPALEKLSEKLDKCHNSSQTRTEANHDGDCPKFSVDYILFIMESIFNSWFALEYIARFMSCDEKKAFVKNWLNIIDVIAILPFSESFQATTVYHSAPMLVQLAIIQLSIALCFAVSIFIVEQGVEGNQFHNMIDATWYALITMYTVGYDKDECKLTADELTNEPTKEKSQRIDHFHKSLTQSLRRNKASLNIFSESFQATTVYHSAPMLVQLAIIQLSIALCFAVSIFIVEQGVEGNQFHNMIDATWYALITMYTVGYGDFVPVSPMGRLLGTGCAILGLLDMGKGF